ncbi:hypothetical protein BJ684DRAFT_21845 [Piptocephalis cylindrospora]|uniref:Uncharacterized protein n=1 Tax=Piptocephalis cylindrospora TaxID=1907219 RepID=A0A4V1IXM5_9FUNG|nr:hypothetical protein BJ684DRAFT_21845 [Piptocephalis cylindrospora]|eukprot:RKP11579.1 hypothetical protein BJ684DRAFT_21845 [Piptocephalis cylindrospora]
MWTFLSGLPNPLRGSPPFRLSIPILLLFLLLDIARLADASIILHANDSDITLRTQNYFLGSQEPIDRSGMLVELTLRDGCLTSPEAANASATTDGTWTRIYNQTIIYASWGNAIRRGCDTYGQLTKVAQEYAMSFSEAGLPPSSTFLILLGPRPARLENTEGSPFLEGYAAHAPGIPDGPVSSGWAVHLLGTVSATQLVNYIRDITFSRKAASCRLIYGRSIRGGRLRLHLHT